MMKKIIFDITLLGAGWKNVRYQTGLYRFTNELLKSFLISQKIDTFFIASQFNFTDCENYLKGNYPHLIKKLISNDKTIRNTFSVLILRRSLKILIKLCKFLKLRSTWLHRIERHFGFLLSILRVKAEYFDNSNLSNYDIYFSPYNAIPLQVRKAQITKVLYVHDLIPILFPKDFKLEIRYFYKKLINSFSPNDTAICNSFNTKKDLLNYRKDLSENRIKVIYPGSNISSENIFEQNSIEAIKLKYSIPEGKYALTLSSLNPRKNFTHVINSFMQFINQNVIEDLNLVVAGPKGWEYEQMIVQVLNNPRTKNKVIFTEFVDDKDLAVLYGNAHFFTLMSLYEGFGFTIIEAMRCGTPVITSNNSSLIEIASEAAICIDPKDSTKLIEAFSKLYFSKETRDYYIELGLKYAAKFSWDNTVNQFVKIFQNSSC